MNSASMLLHVFKENNVFPCALSPSFLPSIGASPLVHFLAIGLVRCREGEVEGEGEGVAVVIGGIVYEVRSVGCVLVYDRSCGSS